MNANMESVVFIETGTWSYCFLLALLVFLILSFISIRNYLFIRHSNFNSIEVLQANYRASWSLLLCFVLGLLFFLQFSLLTVGNFHLILINCGKEHQDNFLIGHSRLLLFNFLFLLLGILFHFCNELYRQRKEIKTITNQDA